MTEDQLKEILGDKELMRKIDIKTLIVDLVKNKFTDEEITEIFYSKLPELEENYVKRFLYMMRG